MRTGVVRLTPRLGWAGVVKDAHRGCATNTKTVVGQVLSRMRTGVLRLKTKTLVGQVSSRMRTGVVRLKTKTMVGQVSSRMRTGVVRLTPRRL
jgi:hypothetical protein